MNFLTRIIENHKKLCFHSSRKFNLFLGILLQKTGNECKIQRIQHDFHQLRNYVTKMEIIEMNYLMGESKIDESISKTPYLIRQIQYHLKSCFHCDANFFECLETLFLKTGNSCLIFSWTTPQQDFLEWKKRVVEIENEANEYYR